MRRLLPLLGALALAATPAAAQQAQQCDLVDTGATVSRSDVPGGQIITVQGGTPNVVFRCTGGLVISGNQMMQFTATRELRFIGDVEYRDSTQHITTDYFIRYGAEERSVARGNVVFRDLTTGSVVTGYEMERFARTFPAGEERTVVRGRPHAELRRAGAQPDTAPPLIVDSDSMVIRAREHFRALGAVALQRGDLHGVGVEAVYDGEAGMLELLGAGARGTPRALPRATLDSDAFDLAADHVVGELAGDELRHLTATGEAVLTARQASVQGPRLDLFFTDGTLDRLVGVARRAGAPVAEEAPATEEAPARPDAEVGPPRRRPGELRPGARPAAAPAPRAAEGERAAGDEERPRVRALAEGLRMVSDSLEILAPGEVIEQVTAVGEAFAERLPPEGEEGDPALPELIARDWIRGDTIVGWFADGPPPAPGDSVERVLERLVAVGAAQPATSLHRLEGQQEGEEDVSYLAARRITLLLREGEVADVEADGPVKGLYLTREQRRQPAETPPATPPPGRMP